MAIKGCPNMPDREGEMLSDDVLGSPFGEALAWTLLAAPLTCLVYEVQVLRYNGSYQGMYGQWQEIVSRCAKVASRFIGPVRWA